MMFRGAFKAIKRFNQKGTGKFAMMLMGSVIAASSAVSAVANSALVMPILTLYPKSEALGIGERKFIEDPKGELRFTNVGASSLEIQSMKIKHNHCIVNSFDGVLAGESFKFSSESSNFLNGGFKGRPFEKNCSIPLVVVRPIDTALNSNLWCSEFEKVLQDVELEVKYKYFPVPLFGYLFTNTVILKSG